MLLRHEVMALAFSVGSGSAIAAPAGFATETATIRFIDGSDLLRFDTDGQPFITEWANGAAEPDADSDGRFELWITGLSENPDQHYNALFVCCGPEGPVELTGRLAASAQVRRSVPAVSGVLTTTWIST